MHTCTHAHTHTVTHIYVHTATLNHMHHLSYTHTHTPFAGQFFRKGVEIDETRHLLLLLPGMSDPVPVMHKPIWHFMEREKAQQEGHLCWVAMNPGYQGKRLIEGSYLDYVVNDLLSLESKN